MCGITGFIDFNFYTDLAIITKMISTINHRGPDDCGIELLTNKFAAIGFSQARLSIIDLSTGGHQPMFFNEYCIVFNGEIYNYKEIKKELIDLNHTFISESDTEVILHAFDQWGIHCVDKFIGMFAFVIYNSKKNDILIFRDRAGVKPLYYYWEDNLFLFASELKCFHEHPKFKKKINLNSVKLYFSQIQYGYIPAPHTIFENTFKLKPGNYLKIDLIKNEILSTEYWNVSSFYKLPKLDIEYKEAKKITSELIHSACQYRMVSDVPVGVFLSGGYDSTAVVANLQTNQTLKLKTFTIGFDQGNNEAPQARQIANFFGTDHTDYTCTKKEAQEIIPTLPFYFDEPFADSSAIPTILVSKLAKKQVSVALSADAGDEIFFGYDRYSKLINVNNKMNTIPSKFKPFINNWGGWGSSFLKNKNHLKSITSSLNSDNYLQMYNLVNNSNALPPGWINDLFLNNSNLNCIFFDIDYKDFNDVNEISMALDYKSYLSDDILTKVDRATMSVSLEGREPLLDHRIIEFAAQLPMVYKLENGNGKKILKDIVHDYIPKELMDRPKSGFSIPVITWLKTDLSYLIDEYLNKTAISQTGMFNVVFVQNKVIDFKKGKLYYLPFIWKLLMFQMWYNKWILNK